METKFHILHPWLDEILTSIRRDIKTDYLPASTTLYRTYFGNRPLNRLTTEEIHKALTKELLQGNQDLAEWVVNRWVFKHGEIYSHFAGKLEAIRPDFSSLETLSEAESAQVLRGAKETFGAKLVYLFTVLNEVVFPPSILQTMRKEAEAEKPLEITVAKNETISLEQHQKDLGRLAEKYEQKIAGVLQKYSRDVASLKSQIRALQKNG